MMSTAHELQARQREFEKKIKAIQETLIDMISDFLMKKEIARIMYEVRFLDMAFDDWYEQWHSNYDIIGETK